MKLSLFTPEKILLEEKTCKEILVPSVKGYLGILPGHANLISLLKAGLLKYLPEKSTKWEKIALGWGYLEVHEGNVRILAESFKTKESLDRAETQKSLKKLEEELKRTDLEPSEREKKEKEKLWLEGQLEL